MSSYLYLGQVKRGIDRGLLLNQALQRVQDTPNFQRKHRVLDGLEIAEVVEIMGLTDMVKSLFLLNRSLYEQDPAQGKAVLRKGLFDLLSQQLGVDAPRPAVRAPVEEPRAQPASPAVSAGAAPTASAPEPLARPVAPAPASHDASEGPAAETPETETPTSSANTSGKPRSPIGGLMSLSKAKG